MTPGRALLFGSTALLWAIVVQTWFGSPLPASAFAFAAVGYAFVLLAGALLPGLEMYGEVLSRVEGERSRYALTFDDGPDPLSTRLVLAELRRAEVRATFFVIGKKALAHPDVVAEILAEGHEVAVHSMGHSYSYALWTPSAVRADLEAVRELLLGLGAPFVRFYRPPVLVVSPRIVAGGRRAGLVLAGASVRALDGGGATPRAIERRLGRVRGGDVVLLHDARENGAELPPVLEVLPRFLDACRARGLVSVTLSELVSGSSERSPRSAAEARSGRPRADFSRE